MAALLIGLSFVGSSYSGPAAAQPTIFDTKDFKQDRALWTNPAYYRNNTAGQLRGMALDIEAPEGATGQPAGARPYG